MNAYPMFLACWTHQESNVMHRHEDAALSQLLTHEGMISQERIENTGPILQEEVESAPFVPLESEGNENRVYNELLELSGRIRP